MKKLVYSAILVLLVFLGRPAWAASATEADNPAMFLELEGESLSQAEMEDILGGLPRCCHLSNYDNIEDKCLNNKGQVYEKSINDCDIWLENVLLQGGIDISAIWGAAKSTSVSRHSELLRGKLSTTAPLGWSIEIIDNSHVALVRINKDGSADLFHQGYNAGTNPTNGWEGSKGYHYSDSKKVNWGNSRRFWKFN